MTQLQELVRRQQAQNALLVQGTAQAQVQEQEQGREWEQEQEQPVPELAQEQERALVQVLETIASQFRRGLSLAALRPKL
jgi:hypothetical protein